MVMLAPDLCGAQDSVLFRSHHVDQWRTNRIIVKWRTEGVAAVQMQRVDDRAARLSRTSGLHFSPARNLFGRTDVMLLDHVPAHDEMSDILARLNADPAIEYAEPDEVRFLQDFPITTQTPNDPHFLPSNDPTNATNADQAIGSWVGQWYLLPSSSSTPAAISATTAWATATQLGSSVTVAVIDSGIAQDHVDLQQNMQTPGYDFVSCDQGNFTSTVTTALGATQGIDQCTASGTAATYFFANENANWNADGTDPGDFIDTNDLTLAEFGSNGCTQTVASSWHGTKVAGVLGAVANNGIGIAGVAPMVKMISVRVIGSCRGALVSDLAPAILWAAGQPVTISSGTIASSPAARIINISLGANTGCSQTENDAIQAAITAGVLVIAAAGNEGGAIDAPANCTGVVSVVGLRHTGDKAPFSNLGTTSLAPTIAAPAGDCVNTTINSPCLYDIETTTDASQTTPSATPNFYTYAAFTDTFFKATGTNLENEEVIGTSFAAPMVSGVAALMMALNPKLTAGQVTARLQSSALPFPTDSPGSSPKPASCPFADATASGSGGSFTEPTTPFECLCSTGTCGAGMLNAASAVTAALAAFAEITASSMSGTPGQKITLNANGSTAAVNHTIKSYLWTTDPSTSGQFSNPNAAITTFVVPSFRSIDVILTITDDAGTTSTASVTIQSAISEATGHKGGSFTPLWLLALAGLTLWQLSRRRRGLPSY